MALVYKTDKDRNRVPDSKDKLISCVRKGYPIRIGWPSGRRDDSTKTVEQVTDSEFLIIASDNEKFSKSSIQKQSCYSGYIIVFATT